MEIKLRVEVEEPPEQVEEGGVRVQAAVDGAEVGGNVVEKVDRHPVLAHEPVLLPAQLLQPRHGRQHTVLLNQTLLKFKHLNAF